MAGQAQRDNERVGPHGVKPGVARRRHRKRSSCSRGKEGDGQRRARSREVGHCRRTAPGRTREIVALVLFGMAVFLFFVLVAGDKGGFVGRGVETALPSPSAVWRSWFRWRFLLWRSTTVFEVKFGARYWFVGAMVFLFGLFLLMAAGFLRSAAHGGARRSCGPSSRDGRGAGRGPLRGVASA